MSWVLRINYPLVSPEDSLPPDVFGLYICRIWKAYLGPLGTNFPTYITEDASFILNKSIKGIVISSV